MLLRSAALLLASLALAACGSTFRTDYEQPASAANSANWRVQDVRVVVPDTLKVSEDKSIFPQADIVWREDPPGDRKRQVAKIIDDAATAGAAPLNGSQRVIVTLTVQRFHALTLEAESRLSNAGVHNIRFEAVVTDAATGQVLFGPELIEAALPAYSGAQMRAMRAAGQTQKSQISAHLRGVIAGWLGVGADARNQFSRLGG